MPSSFRYSGVHKLTVFPGKEPIWYWGLSRIPGGRPHERLCMEFARPQLTKLTDEELFFFRCYDVTVLYKLVFLTEYFKRDGISLTTHCVHFLYSLCSLDTKNKTKLSCNKFNLGAVKKLC